jgi:predicted transcriptional regulator
MKVNIIKIDHSNIDTKSSLLKELREVVIEAENLYPGIDKWFDKKVKSGIQLGERTCYLVQKDNQPIGAAVIKQGEDAKICTVRIRDNNVYRSFGSVLFLLIAFGLRRNTKKVHFTAPEDLWFSCEKFFRDMGFFKKGPSETQYRLFMQEIVASADYHQFRNRVFEKYLGRFAGILAQIENEKIDLVFSLKPEYAKRIINKTKVMDLRRRFSKRWIGASAIIYSSSPERAFVAKFRIKDVFKDHPISLWNNWREIIDCNEQEFIDYTKNLNEVYGILIDDVRNIGPIYLSAIEGFLNSTLTPPQSYLEISHNEKWKSAIALSNMLTQNI